MAIVLESINDEFQRVYSDKERQLIHIVRTMLKDLPQEAYRSLNTLVEERRGERWTDEQLYVYITQAIADINSEPPLTVFTVADVPDSLDGCITIGAVIFALLAESIVQSGETFSYSDNGISLSIDLASKYQGIAQTFLNSYIQMRKDIKRSMRPQAAGVKSNPAPVRLRSYAPRMWCYR